jgi:hypothetical protein
MAGDNPSAELLAPGVLDRLGSARALVDALIDEIAAAGPRPVVDDLGWQWPGWVAVTLDPAGFGVSVRHGDGREADPDAPVLRPLSAPSAALGGVLEAWVEARWARLGRSPLDAGTQRRVLRALGQVLARHPAVRAWEAEGAKALAIPPAVLRLARALERCQPRAPHRQLRARSLDVAWRHYAALTRARRENPALFPLLAAYAAEHGLRPGTDPVRQLKEWCRFRGLSQAEWARLAQVGTDDAQWALRLVGDRVSHLELVVGLARIERALGQRLGDLDGDARIRWLANLDPWRGRLEVEHAARLAARSGAPDARAAETLGLLHAGLDSGQLASAEVLAMRGWRAIERRVVESMLPGARDGARFDETRDPACRDTQVAWIESLAIPAAMLVARRLRSRADLAAEGAAMRHCIATYAPRVGRGSSLVYAIRGPAGEPVATAALKRRRAAHGQDAAWVLDDVRGLADRPAPAAARQMTVTLLAACNGPEGPPEQFTLSRTQAPTDDGIGPDRE